MTTTSNPGASRESSEPQTSLRGFWSLFVTQFQGAFSDNALKWLAIFLIATMGFSDAQRDRLVSITGALFALPFIVFSMAGGFLCDRFSKRSVSIGVKTFEIFVMLLALVGLAIHQLYLTIGCVFLMGVHSAFFGPAKYGLLPELLPEKKLSWGNGVLELGTFLAIIFGTVAGGWMCKTFSAQPAWSGAILIALAAFGLSTSFGVTKVPAADPSKKFNPNFLRELWKQIQIARKDRALWLAVWGNTYFFAIAALIQFLIVIYAQDALGISDPQKSSYLQAATAIGIGFGSFAAGYLSGGKIEYGLIPLGAIGLTVFCALLGRTGLSFLHVAIDLALLGFFGGFFIVPISALLQHRPAREEKGSLLAAANLLSFVGIFLASGIYYFLTVTLKLSPPAVFLVIAAMTFAATIYIVALLPDSLLRFILWLLTRTLYRIKVLGRDNIPAKGGALFVCNHVSFVDALLLLASTDRRVRFMMLKSHYELPFLKPFARLLGIIPISSEQRPREMLHSLQAASDAIRAGEVVCIFAEGQITRIGHLLPFRRGFERIMKDVEAPIIPVALDGVWGSIFSFEKGRFLWKVPRRIPYPITINFGKALPPTAAPFEVRQAVQELLAEAWQFRKSRMKPLHRAFVKTARRRPFRFAMADLQNKNVSFGSALTRTIFLARRLRKTWAEQEMIGLLLPPSVPGALVNFAAMLSGKIPVNLNYTVSHETLASCIQQCEIKTVVTSRAFLEKLKLDVPCETVFLEEIAAAPSALEKFAAFSALIFPIGLLERFCGRISGKKITQNSKLKTHHSEKSLNDLATVIFSSGSTGDPKGVMLSHYNIGANIEQLEQVFGLNRADRILGILPFFHSFGFTGTLCLPAMSGIGVVYHPNPLDAKVIGPLVREYGISFLLATPTFLQFYMRSCAPGDFGSLRVVMTAAEKLPERLASAFEEQFGIRPLEGYGCTECSPAVAVNTPDFRSAGFRQVGAKRGKIGHPIPGVSVRIVDPETRAPMPVGKSGLLLVRGPNVMRGYLGRPEKTAEVLIGGETLNPGFSPVQRETAARMPGEGGWYVTGDIAAIDEDGFLQITDRLSRFSKIGGEMVPHIKVEEKLHELAGATEQSFVVIGLPDEKKGERLVVLHKIAHDKLQECFEKLAQCDLPNLWKPRPDQFFYVSEFAYLGTGKLNLRKCREIAMQLSAENCLA
ncbi:MAG TPA: acyl-[ACP]--phospholipid O-acyltransferase [Verrucomicrobiae bacterium]|nr:acyl-[ACP]--phospholipid O-acyltransferase [Verrucomicrobiae bacterium]